MLKYATAIYLFLLHILHECYIRWISAVNLQWFCSLVLMNDINYNHNLQLYTCIFYAYQFIQALWRMPQNGCILFVWNATFLNLFFTFSIRQKLFSKLKTVIKNQIAAVNEKFKKFWINLNIYLLNYLPFCSKHISNLWICNLSRWNATIFS